MVLLLIIIIFTAIFIFASIKSTRGYIDNNHSYSEVPTQYHMMDDKFMLCNYMNYQESKHEMDCSPVQKEIRYPVKHRRKHSSKVNINENRNFKVIRGNKNCK